jgi:HK97 gp10 family phage protein
MAEVTIKSYKTERLKEITDSLEKKMIQVMKVVSNQAVQNVTKTGSEHPQRKTGQLASSIHKTSRVEMSGNEIAAIIGSNITSPPYPHYLEFGTSRMPPYPWLFPAVEMSRDKIVDILGSKKFGVE